MTERAARLGTPAQVGAYSGAVRCASCGREGRDDAQFCDRCGAELAVVPASGAPPEHFAEGRYRVRSVVGEGLRKIVYLARDTRLDRDVALAVLRLDGVTDAERERVEREIRMFAWLGGHPNIVQLYDVEDLDGAVGLVFEFVPGSTVADVLELAGGVGLPVADALRIGEQVAQALGQVHRHGVVFRDVKSRNVLLTGDGTAKLCDFGLALRPGDARLTDEKLVVGSLAYIAPERVARHHYDYRSDLYSLGVLLYEMLTGRPPFDGDDPDEVGAQHLHAEPPPIDGWRKGVPDQVQSLVLRLLAKRLDERPSSAAEVAAVLRRLRGDTASPSA